MTRVDECGDAPFVIRFTQNSLASMLPVFTISRPPSVPMTLLVLLFSARKMIDVRSPKHGHSKSLCRTQHAMVHYLLAQHARCLDELYLARCTSVTFTRKRDSEDFREMENYHTYRKLYAYATIQTDSTLNRHE